MFQDFAIEMTEVTDLKSNRTARANICQGMHQDYAWLQEYMFTGYLYINCGGECICILTKTNIFISS